nr:hypothetical protein B0A51_15636 [Rachicladosporium sp. CCFEE 5018]
MTACPHFVSFAHSAIHVGKSIFTELSVDVYAPLGVFAPQKVWKVLPLEMTFWPSPVGQMSVGAGGEEEELELDLEDVVVREVVLDDAVVNVFAELEDVEVFTELILIEVVATLLAELEDVGRADVVEEPVFVELVLLKEVLNEVELDAGLATATLPDSVHCYQVRHQVSTVNNVRTD